MGKDKVSLMEFNLITAHGVIALSFPSPAETVVGQEIWDEMMASWRAQSIWNCGNRDCVSATYQGTRVSYIDFNKVIAAG